ncbi:MAG: carbohydate-binding domain-containing protein [Candidatus Riflebacteria bacterium]|nr:carbohydate-binding domain-containing protein [Candidatus Riflebacteria bacterium]
MGNKPQSRAKFVFINNSKCTFPSSGWTIYFSSCKGIELATGNSEFSVAHLNGDIYRLFPERTFRGLKPGESKEFYYNYDDLVLNQTSAPCGLYIVWSNFPEKGFTLPKFSTSLIRDSSVNFLTPEEIYEKNRKICDIPPSKLPKIFPTPVCYEERNGEFLLNSDTRVYFDPVFQKEAIFLQNELSRLLKKRISVFPDDSIMNDQKFSDNSKQIFRKITLKKRNMADEAYQLSVSSEGIEIAGGTCTGIFWGIQSLKSLLPPTTWAARQSEVKVPAITVSDFPRFKYRSLLCDVARNFKSKEQIMKVLDLMALYKLNILHLHLVDDEGWRLEISSLPELTEVGAKRGHTLDSKTRLPPSFASGPEPGKSMGTGYYSRSDFIKILKYATERHIMVIPEIESPGHSRAAIKAMDARYEKLLRQGKKEEAEAYLLRDLNDQSVYCSAQAWTDNVMCVALPSTYQFLRTVIDEIIEIYEEADAPLNTIHFGGDEVPEGAWKKSPACLELIEHDTSLHTIDDLWYYYFSKISAMLKVRDLFLSGWEEVALRKTLLDGKKHMIPNPGFLSENFQVHVWNNMIGWGAEDLPYRLANAGYKVVLSCVSNNYFDLAYSKSPDEPGFYWGGFQDIDKPFYFVPFDYYKTTKEDAAGNPANPEYFLGKDRLTDYGKSNIVGVQGLLWGENLRSNDAMEYLLLPKLLGLAERAWAKDPKWATENDKIKSQNLYDYAWSEFVNIIGKRELPRLDYYSGGFKYRIPPVGVIRENGKILVNNQFPGLAICYTTDGTEPTLQSTKYFGPITNKGIIKFKAFDSLGRGGKTTESVQ